MTVFDCYKILELPHGARWPEVKKAYRNLAKKYHPDKSQKNSINSLRFQNVSRAYQILEVYYQKNKMQKITFPSRNLVKYSQPEETAVFEENLSHKTTKLKSHPRFSFMEKFRQIIFSMEQLWFPLDIYQGVTIDPHTAKVGGMIRIRSSREIFNVKVPRNVRHGTQLKIPSRGQNSWTYNRRGDLFLKLRVIPSEAVRPGTTNMFYDMEIQREDLGLGKVFTLHTIQGPIKFFPPKNTQDGQVFILKYRPDESRSKKLTHILTVKLT